jgi:hypothetical protein
MGDLTKAQEVDLTILLVDSITALLVDLKKV